MDYTEKFIEEASSLYWGKDIDGQPLYVDKDALEWMSGWWLTQVITPLQEKHEQEILDTKISEAEAWKKCKDQWQREALTELLESLLLAEDCDCCKANKSLITKMLKE
jgi:hypothetical protein